MSATARTRPARKARSAPRRAKSAGGGVFAIGLIVALGWIGSVIAAAIAYWGVEALIALPPAQIALIAWAALVPALLMLFSAVATRAALAAGAQAARLTAIAEDALAAPSPAAAQSARDLARALARDLGALDEITRTTALRLDGFQRALRTDGGELAQALAREIRAMDMARGALKADAEAFGAAAVEHMARLRDTAKYVKAETGAAERGLAEQIDAFSTIAAQIGDRSVEIATAAATAGGSAEKLDTAVAGALDALAHATSLTDSARLSAEHAAEAAKETAQALREGSRRAVAEAREAAKTIRTEVEAARAGAPAPISSGQSFAARMSGVGAKRNFMPETLEAANDEDDLATLLRRPAKKALNAAPAVEPSLVSIVDAAGVRLEDALSAADLDHIARQGDNDARRQAVKDVAPQALRRVSGYLRRDRAARHTAETLRREPARALASGRKRDAACAYLLVDAALG